MPIVENYVALNEIPAFFIILQLVIFSRNNENQKMAFQNVVQARVHKWKLRKQLTCFVGR